MPIIYKLFIVLVLVYSLISAGIYVYSGSKERKEQKFTEAHDPSSDRTFKIVKSF